MTEDASGGCLQRDFQFDDELPTERDLRDLLRTPPRHFKHFEETLRLDFHNGFHNAVCGHMCLDTAANDPIFFLLHTFLDKAWSDWQSKGHKHKYAYYKTKRRNRPLTYAKISPLPLLDITNMFNTTCVNYT